VFIMVGAPGLLVAGLLLLVRDPRKVGTATRGAAANRALRDFFIGHWRFASIYTMATALLVMLLNAHIAWIPASLMRAHGLSPAAMGALFGPVYLCAGAAGTILSGQIVGRAAGDDMVARALTVMRAAAILLIPAAIAAPLVGPLWAKLALAGGAVFFTSAILSMASLPFQFAAPLSVRAQAIALQGLIASLVGTGLGPLIVGALSDGFAFAARPLSLALAVLGAAITPLILLLLHLVLAQHRRVRLDLLRQAA
jgi:hypothetical protein